MTEIEIDFHGIDERDMSKYSTLCEDRKKIIHDSSSQSIHTDFIVNQLADKLHPSFQYVKVLEIIEETEDTKSFILGPDIEKGTKELAYFKAGQYVSVEIPIHGGVYNRPYSLSCSPKLALDNKYKITVKKVLHGIVSNYLFDFLQVGDSLKISAPAGYFTYERLRDARHIVAIAGGSGITPFMSIIEAIYDGILDISLTLLYGVKTEADIVFKKRLDEIASKTKKVKVVYVLSEEENELYYAGFIDKNIIDPCLQEENSFFLCGPVAMYSYLNEVLKEYGIPNKYIRYDAFIGEVSKVNTKEYVLTVLTLGEEIKIPCYGNESLLSSIERSGILLPSKCHVGVCGLCRSKLISGKVRALDCDMRMKDKNFNYIHPCESFPESDIVLKLPK